GVALRSVNAFEWGEETATDSTPRDVLLVRVRRAAAETAAANYRLRLVSLAQPTPLDFTRVSAEEASTDARKLMSRTPPAPSKLNVDAWRRAVELWRESGDVDALRRAEILLADALSSTGSLSEARAGYSEMLRAALAAQDSRSAAQC